MKNVILLTIFSLIASTICGQEYFENHTASNTTGYQAVDVVYNDDTETYVLASVVNAGVKKGLIIAYGEELSERWSTFISTGEGDVPIGILLDNDENVIVASNSDGGNAHVFIYNRNGTPLQVFTYNNTVIHDFTVDQISTETSVYLAGETSSGDAFAARIINAVQGGDAGSWEETYAGSSSQGAAYLDLEIDPDRNGVVFIGWQQSGANKVPIISAHSMSNGSMIQEFTMDFSNNFDEEKGMKLVSNDQGDNVTLFTAIYSSNSIVFDSYNLSNFSQVSFSEVNSQGSYDFYSVDILETITDAIIDNKGRLIIATTHQIATFYFHYVANLSVSYIEQIELPAPGQNSLSIDKYGDIFIGYGSNSLNFRKFDINLNLLDETMSSETNAQNFADMILFNEDTPFLIGGSSSGGVHSTYFCHPTSITFDQSVSGFDSRYDTYFICPDESTTITATIGIGATAVWDEDNEISNTSNLTQMFSTAGVYYLTATRNGCSIRRAVVVEEYNNLPSKVIWVGTKAIVSPTDPDMNQSFEGSFSLDLKGHLEAGGNVFIYEYYWFHKDGSGEDLIGITENKDVITVSEPGEYYALIYWGGGTYDGCDYQKTYSVFVESTPTIDFDPIPTKTYGDQTFQLNATSSSGAQVIFESSNQSVATIDGNTVTIVGAGQSTITASTEADDFYGAGEAQQTLTVDKANQTISFTDPGQLKYSDSEVELDASASSGLTVMFESSDEGVASLIGNTLMIHDIGQIDITAIQTGSTNYNPANDFVRSITIDKGDQIISFNELFPKQVNSPDFDLSANSSSGLTISYNSSDENVAIVSGNTVSIVGPGETVITASQSGNSQYNPAPEVPQTLIVNKLSQNVSLGSISDKTYGDAPAFVYASASSDLPVVFQSSDETIVAFPDPVEETSPGNYRTFIHVNGVGSVTVTAYQDGDDTYQSDSESQEVTVVKADQSISFASLNPVKYDNPDFALTGSASSGLVMTYASSNDNVATVNGSTVTIIGVGQTTITASQLGNSNYNPAISIQQTLVVNKADQNISFDAIDPKSYGDPSFDLFATSSSGLNITYSSNDESVAAVSGNTVTIVGAGSAMITASQEGSSNYEAASDVTQSLEVAKADQEISFTQPGQKTFGEPDFSLTVSGGASENTVVLSSSDESIATISGSTVSIAGAGIATITANQAGNENYYAADEVSRELVVLKADQTISFGVLEDMRPNESVTLTASSSSSLPISFNVSGPAELEGNELTTTGEGMVTVTASQSGNSNYNAAPVVERSFQVEDKNSQTITFQELEERRFGDVPFNLSATASSGLAVSYESSDKSVAAIAGTEVTIVGAGTTIITASQAGDDEYFAATPILQELIVQKADQIISFEGLTEKKLDDEDFSLIATSSAGLEVFFTSTDQNVATITGDVVSIVGVGSTLIIATQEGNSNFNAAPAVEQMLIVSSAKHSQTITFEPLEDKKYGDDPFALSAVATSGLSVTFESSDESIATISGDQVTILAAGQLTITATQDGDATYKAADAVSQELMITKASQIITFEPFEDMLEGETISLNATSNSGLEVSFDINGPATIEGNLLTAIEEGTVTITASQSGSDNWNPAESVIQTLEILSTALSVSDEPISIYPNPFINVLNLDYYEPVDIRIYAMNGSMVWSKQNIKDQLDVSSLDEGMYILEVEHTTKITRLRIRKAN